MFKMNAETFGFKPYIGQRSRGGYRGRGRGRGYRNTRGYQPRGSRGYRSRGGYQQNYDDNSRGGYQQSYSDNSSYYASQGYKKGYDHDQNYEKPYKPYYKQELNSEDTYEKPYKSYYKPDHGAEEALEKDHKHTGDGEELSFPEYKPPQVHYGRGAGGGKKRGSTNQGTQGKANRGRFAYFTEDHDT